MLVVKILSGMVFIGSIIWFIAQPDYEPAIGIISSLATFVGVLISEKKKKKKKTTAGQNQVVKQNAIGIQAGGNVQTGDITSNKN